MRNGNRISSTFRKIEKRLDPDYCYLVFEVISEENDKHYKIFDVLSCYKKGIFEREIHRDRAGGGFFVLVKLDSEHEDDVIQELVQVRFPSDMNFYVYGRRVK